LVQDPPPTCDIVIVTCNRLDNTKRCIESIEKNTGGAVRHRYIFVDNNSTDGTLQYLKRFDSSVLIENGDDVGFVRAMNQGLKKTGADYVAWLSTGAVVTPGWLDTLVGHLKDSPDAGAIGPMSNVPGNMQCDYSWNAKTDPQEVSEYGKGFHAKNEGLAVEYHRVGGFCMVMRSDTVSEIGQLDERFNLGPLYDDDYCKRICDAGRRVLIAGDVFVYCANDAESPRTGDPDADPAFLGQINRDRFLRKWMPQDGNRSQAPKNPLVSVIMATRDREPVIPTAIKSVLSQTYGNFELIVINDGGKDIGATIDGFGDPRIKYMVLEEHKGKSYANNYAIDRAGGEIIAYLDDDDRWYADHLEVAVGELVKFESRMLVYADYVQVDCKVDRSGVPVPIEKKLKKLKNAGYDPVDQGNFIPNFAVVHRKELSRIERYDERLDFSEDWDMLRRFSKHAYFVRIPKTTGEYWLNTGEPTRNRGVFVDKNIDAVHNYIVTKLCVTKNRVVLDLYSADKLAESSEWSDALDIYEGILKTDPEYIPALEGYASCLYNLLQYRKCSGVLDRVIKRDSDNYEMYMLQSHALIDSGHHGKAKAWLELALVVDHNPGALHLLRECYKRLNKQGSSEFIGIQAQKERDRDEPASEQPMPKSGVFVRLAELQGELDEAGARASRLDEEITAKDARMAELQGELDEAGARASRLDEEITAKDARMAELDDDINNYRSIVADYQNSITEFQQSFVLRMCHRYDRLVGKIIPTKMKKHARSSAAQPVPDTSQPRSIKKDDASALVKKDIVCFPIIDWHFRYQRSQHIMSKFAQAGHRVFYLTVDLEPLKTPYEITEIKKNVYQIRLHSPIPFNIYRDKFSTKVVNEVMESFRQAKSALNIDGISFVQFPTWFSLVQQMQKKHDMGIVFDILDEFTGFDNVSKSRIKEEKSLIERSDIVTASSSHLMKKTKRSSTVVLPNGCDYEHFSQNSTRLLSDHTKPIIGYFGAISSWFDTSLVEHAAAKRTDWTFVLIGHTAGADVTKLQKLHNVVFLGERPYADLPNYLVDFDVCLIPFVDSDLIDAVNPVKIYEYLAAGKPVVATNMLELLPMSDLCYLSKNRKEFLANIERALAEDDGDIRERRKRFARQNTWDARFQKLHDVMAGSDALRLNSHT